MRFGQCTAFVGFVALVASAPPVGAAPPAAELPLQFEKNLPLAAIRVNGTAVLFILDSAASGCVIDAHAAAAIGIAATDSAMASGSGGMATVSLARGIQLALGAVEIAPEFVVLADLANLGFEKPVRGILGFPLFGTHAVELDYAARRARLFEPAQFEAPPAAEVLPLWMTDGPTVRGRVSLTGRDTLALDLQLDTGSSHVLTFCKPFVDRHHLLETVPGLVDGDTQGIGGGSKDKVGRIARVTLGGASVEQPEVRFSTHPDGTLARNRFAANLGNGFLARHVVTFDIPHGRLFLRRPELNAR